MDEQEKKKGWVTRAKEAITRFAADHPVLTGFLIGVAACVVTHWTPVTRNGWAVLSNL